MEIVIKSPFIPLLFKQKIVEGHVEVGYLSRQFRYLHSYEAGFKGQVVRLIERKKVNGKRNWTLIGVRDGMGIGLGSLIMSSSTKELMSKGVTEYTLDYRGEVYSVAKAYMHHKNYCDLLNEKGERVATHAEQKILSWQRKIRIDMEPLSTLDCSVFILVLSLIIFIS